MIRRWSSTPEFAPNLAPLVDVVMVILIFFMLCTSFARMEGALASHLAVDSAAGRAINVEMIPPIRISLKPARQPGRCRISIADHGLPEDGFDALRQALRMKIQQGADPRGRIIIDSDPGVRYQAVIATLDACVRAEWKNLQFAVAERTAGEPAR